MSDNELDQELLGMVGGESDDDGEDLEQTQDIEDRSPTPEVRKRVDKVEEVPKRTKGIAQKVKKSRKRVRKPESEEDDELGDRRSPSVDSLGSGAMDESDGEVDAAGSPDIEDVPLYPLEGKYQDVHDRETLLAMNEIAREEILADRAQIVLKRTQDLQLKKALATAAGAANKHKRKADAAELKDGGSRSMRPKAEKAGRTALDEYKRARELKGTDRGRLDSGKDRKDERVPSPAGSDRDAEGESEVEWAEPAAHDRTREEAPAALRDFERCRIGRSNFAKVCFYPGFEDAIKGCFARVSIGTNRETGQNMYRMTQIKGFTEGRPYQMEGSNGKHFTTDQYAIVAHGTAEKPWPFGACSDSRFTDQELDRFVATLKKENMRLPKKAYLEARLDDIHKLLNIEWTDDLLSKKFANQRAMERKQDPANAARLKREPILRRRASAEGANDTDELTRCDAELAALDNNAQSSNGANGNGVKPGSSTTKKMGPGGELSKQDRLAQLNQRNRGKNVQEVRKALIEEKRRLQAAREVAIAEAKAKADVKAAAEAAKLKAEEDARLLAVPRSEMAELFGDASDISRAGTPLSGAGTPKRRRAGTPLGGGVKREKSGVGMVGAVKRKALDEEVIGGLDMGIDVEI